MTIPTFPSELPKPLASGYASQRFDPRRRRTFDAGPPKFSRRYSKVATSRTFTMWLWAWQKAVFDGFYIEQCAEGSLPFYMTDDTVDGLSVLDESLRFLTDENDVPILCAKRMLCLWGDAPPTFGTAVTTRQLVSFSILEMP